ncbi:MAG: hypothetical protein JWO06_2921 [Bacteroidota bacterium]|nr:hypothetical protein [Bacteroidota bacterium]
MSMNLDDLKAKLRTNKIPENRYSLDGELKPMAYVLYENYAVFEIFYMNERGGRDDFHAFNNYEEALDFLWQRMEYYVKHPPNIPPKSVFGK